MRPATCRPPSPPPAPTCRATCPRCRCCESSIRPPSPILSLTLTSGNRLASELYDIADLIVSSRIAQVPGVAEVTVGGAEQPAFRVAIDPTALQSRGIGLEAVRSAIAGATSLGPDRTLRWPRHERPHRNQRPDPQASRNFPESSCERDAGNVVRLTDVARVEAATRNSRTAGWLQPPAGRDAHGAEDSRRPTSSRRSGASARSCPS